MLHNKIDFLGSNGSTHYYLNDRTGIDSNWKAGDPYYISVDAVDGLNSADISYESHPLPNLIGEKSGDVFRRGKGITLSGTIWAYNLGSLAVGSEYLSQVFWDTALRKLIFYPLANSTQVYLWCRVNNDLSVVQTKPQDYNYRWAWTVGLRADDPRMYNYVGDTLYRSWMT